MNKTHRSLWNCALGAWVAVSEITRARGKRGAGGNAVVIVAPANRTGSMSRSNPISQPAWLSAGLPILAALAIVFPASAKTIRGSEEITTSAKDLQTAKYSLDISNDATKATMIVKGLGSVINTQGVLGSRRGSTGEATVTGPHALWRNVKELFVGLEGQGILTVSNGATVNNSEGYVGDTQGSTGTVDVIGKNSSWKTRETLVVGGAGTGTLRVSAGATVENVQGQIAGLEGSFGTVAVTGPGSSWLNHEALFVGNAGQGTLMVSQGAKVKSYQGEIGSEGSSHGEATVTGNGSSWNSLGKLFIGNAGKGSLIVSQGAAVTNTQAQVGVQPNSVGRAEVTGAGSLWNNDGELLVGNEGHGTLIVSGGATVKNTHAEIGVEKDSIGTAKVTGAGSSWISSEPLLIGSAGHGTLTVSEGANVKNTQGEIGTAEGSDGTVTVSGAGALWSNSEALFVGVAGKGTLTVLDGATVKNTQGEIGTAEGSDGTVTVSGAGALWSNSEVLFVGVAGKGTLTVLEGAKVTNTQAEIGNAAGSIGKAEVSGKASWWINSGALYVGVAGGGTLTISDGATVTNTLALIGSATGSHSTAEVTGENSSWSSSETLLIGNAGQGTLTVSDGAKVKNTQAEIGTRTGATGVVTVTGAGSSWNNSEALLVGVAGHAKLTVSDGAKLQNTVGEIGSQVGSAGTAEVTGQGSLWNNSEALFVGFEGAAVMTIANQAIVSVGNGAQALQVAVENGSIGTVNIGAPEGFPAEAAGTVAASELTFGNGTGRLNFNHTHDDYEFAPRIAGPGQLHQIAGTTILKGDSSFDQTVIHGGTLRIAEGASVSNSKGVIGNTPGITGRAEVAGEDSSWIAGEFAVGRTGTGILTVTHGASVSHTKGAIGHFRNSSGSVDVTGEGSSFDSAQALYVGAFGSGTLTLKGKGQASVLMGDGTLHVASQTGSVGTVNIGAPQGQPAQAAGMLVAKALNFGAGVGRLNFNHTHDDYEFSPRIQGAGQLNQIAGTTTVTAANTYTGATDIIGGSLRAGAANSFSSESSHDVAQAATLDLAGFDQKLSHLSNSGTVRLSDGRADAGAFKGTTLTITGPYMGHGGRLEMSSVLHDSNSASDRVLFSGDQAVASGSTTVHVTNVGGLGAQTMGRGIEIIGTENGARLDPGAFTLAGGHVDAGAFEYRLVQDGHGASLHSSRPLDITAPMNLAASAAAAPAAQPTAPTTTPAAVSAPARPAVTYRAEVPLLSALPAQLRQADMAMLGDMHQRLGDAPDGAGRGTRKTWGRILRTDPRIHQHGTVSPQSSGHLDGFQAGLDVYADRSVAAGLYVGELKGNMAVHGFASGIQNKAVGHNHLQSRYLGFYGTWQADTGRYADAVLQAADYRSQLKTDNSAASTSGRGWLASLEVGQALAINSQWQVEPQAQLIYRQISLDDTALSGANVQHSTPSDWTMRLGVRLKASMATAAGTLEPYGRINVYKTSGINDVARFNTPSASTAIEAKAGYTSTALAAGATLHIGKRSSVYGELGQHWANGGDTRVKSGLQASLGMKVRW